ncbi:MAG: PfkB family carbohydrate kinase [Kofleriaceae bacterium]
MSTSDEAVVVWGELLWDRFPDGARLGGAPANVAFHLGQAGGWARLVSRVGDDDDGRRAIDDISAFVDPSLIQIDPERATGEVTIHLVGGEPRYTLQPGRAWERIACTPATSVAIGEAGVLIYGTLSQRTPEGLAAWEGAIAAAGPGCMKVCDVNLRRRADGVMIEDPHVVARALAAADVIKVNDKELATLAQTFGWADPIAALLAGVSTSPANSNAMEPALASSPSRSTASVSRAPLAASPSSSTASTTSTDSSTPSVATSEAAHRARRVLAITHGAAGSTLYGDGAPIEIPGVQSRPGGDNVGCGDAYVALLVLGMTMGFDLATSGRIAARWAAAVASVRGATPVFEEHEIAHMLELEA